MLGAFKSWGAYLLMVTCTRAYIEFLFELKNSCKRLRIGIKRVTGSARRGGGFLCFWKTGRHSRTCIDFVNFRLAPFCLPIDISNRQL